MFFKQRKAERALELFDLRAGAAQRCFGLVSQGEEIKQRFGQLQTNILNYQFSYLCLTPATTARSQKLGSRLDEVCRDMHAYCVYYQAIVTASSTSELSRRELAKWREEASRLRSQGADLLDHLARQRNCYEQLLEQTLIIPEVIDQRMSICTTLRDHLRQKVAHYERSLGGGDGTQLADVHLAVALTAVGKVCMRIEQTALSIADKKPLKWASRHLEIAERYAVSATKALEALEQEIECDTY